MADLIIIHMLYLRHGQGLRQIYCTVMLRGALYG